jgi:hypothetical protein
MFEQEFDALTRKRETVSRLLDAQKKHEADEAAKREANEAAVKRRAEAKRVAAEKHLKEATISALLSNPACSREQAEKMWDEGLKEKIFERVADESRVKAQRASNAFYRNTF